MRSNTIEQYFFMDNLCVFKQLVTNAMVTYLMPDILFGLAGI